MERAIEVIEDRIMMLSGRIAKVDPVGDFAEITKMVIIKQWEIEVEELKKAQLILSNCK